MGNEEDFLIHRGNLAEWLRQMASKLEAAGMSGAALIIRRDVVAAELEVFAYQLRRAIRVRAPA